jgi:ABC-type transporter Mla subunit MlaD
MTATLSFGDDEKSHMLLAIHAPDVARIVTDADAAIRNLRKHGHTFKDADEALDACRALLSDAVAVIQECYVE